MAALQVDSAYKTSPRKLLLLLSLSLLVDQASARPAPWYWWANRAGDQRICAQTSPGTGWSREDRAFRDSHCSIRVKPF